MSYCYISYPFYSLRANPCSPMMVFGSDGIARIVIEELEKQLGKKYGIVVWISPDFWPEFKERQKIQKIYYSYKCAILDLGLKIPQQQNQFGRYDLR